MKTSLVIPDTQMLEIDRVAKRLGLPRADALRFLITAALTSEQTRGAQVDTAEGTQMLARMAERVEAEENRRHHKMPPARKRR